MAFEQSGAPGPAIAAAVLRMEIDAVLADWAYHLDHGEFDELAELFTEDARFVTGAVELTGRAQIKNRYMERTVVRSTRHTYSGLRVSAVRGAPGPAQVRARSTWVNYAANVPVPADDVGVYLVADFDDVLTWCPDDRWRISERRIIPVFRDPARAPVTA
jgi:3-phenylpropionate/cinnamic acid dioxygenase small subunit